MKTPRPIQRLALLAALCTLHFALCLMAPAQGLPSTGFTRQLLRAADAGEARGILGVGTNGVAFTNYTENTGWVTLSGVTTNDGGTTIINGGTTNHGVGFHGNGGGLTNLGAANIAAGGTAPQLTLTTPNVSGKQTNSDYLIIGATTATDIPAGSRGLGLSAASLRVSSPANIQNMLDNDQATSPTSAQWSVFNGDTNTVFTISESGDAATAGTYSGLGTGLTNSGGFGPIWSNSVIPLASPLSVGATNTGGYGIVWSNSVLPLSSPLSVGATNTGGGAVLFEGDATTFGDLTNTATAIFMEMFESVIQTNVSVLTLSGVMTNLVLNTETNYLWGLPLLVTGYNATSNWCDFIWLAPSTLDTNYGMRLTIPMVKAASDPTDVSVIEVTYLPFISSTTMSSQPSTGLISTTNDSGGSAYTTTLLTIDLSSWSGGIAPGTLAKIRVQRAGGNASETYGNSLAIMPPTLYWVPQ